MNEALLSIGKMAALNRISVSTLRLYDEKGLLKPCYTDPNTGYRYYNINQNARLDMIVYMKELGMSLAEIGQVLKKEQLHQQIRQLKDRHDAVERAILSIERYRKSPDTGTFSLEYIDRRYTWGIPCMCNFYDDDVHSYEDLLRQLRVKLAEEGFDQIHSYNIGTSIAQTDFEEEHFTAAHIFIFLGHREQKGQKEAGIVESGMYACVYLDNYDDEITYARRLRAYCREQGYTIAGDYICEVMSGFHVFDDDPRSMFLRLQIPVSFQK